MSSPFKTPAGEYAYWFGMLYAAYSRIDELERKEDKRRIEDILDRAKAKKVDPECEES